VVSLNDSAVDFVSEYCHDDYLPSAILRCGQITKQQWLDRVVREEDKVRCHLTSTLPACEVDQSEPTHN
jgi:hypothetical protein